LILKKISKIGATRCQILRLKCTKFDFGWGSTPAPAGGAHSTPPDPLAGFKGPTSKGEEGKGGEGKGRGRKGPKGREKEPPFQNVCARACIVMHLGFGGIFSDRFIAATVTMFCFLTLLD